MVILLLAVLVAQAPESPTKTGWQVAVTIDDVPWTGGGEPEQVVPGTRRLLAAFSSRRIPVTGFVTCANVLASRAALEQWRGGLVELGNHSTSHPDLNTVPVDEWLADVETCHHELERVTGGSSVYFRFPFLHRGDTRESHSRAARGLRELGYVTAPVTIDNSEWVIAAAYRTAAERGDSVEMERLGTLYVSHVREMSRHARGIAHERLGRDVTHILLLHANMLAADRVGGLLDSLSADGAEFVDLGVALDDPVYSLPDDYIGPAGLSWLYRIRPARPELAVQDEAAEAEVRKSVAAR